LVYILWSLPVLVAAILVGSRRTSSAKAGFCGLVIAILVGLVSAPSDFGPRQAMLAVAQGTWLAVLVGSVILGGITFRELVSATTDEGQSTPVLSTLRRDELYAACFLFGPFAEAATGFGVGQVAIAPILKRLNLAAIDTVLLGLFSQTMVPWGALANGTIVGAQLSGLSPMALGVDSAILIAPLLLGWLCLFWRFAARAGVPGTWRNLVTETVATIALAACLVLANMGLGPEVAGMAALAPFICVRFLLSKGLDRRRWRIAIRIGVPYAVLIGGIVATRAIVPVNQFLSQVVSVRPLAEGPTWFPLLHPSSWLLVVAIVTAALTGRPQSIAGGLRRAWTLGRSPVLAIIAFLSMSQVMFVSGIANGCAQAVQLALGPAAALATPLFAGLFGFLTSSSAAANGLLMPAQAALAQSGHLSLRWLAALQNVAAAALTILCPVRVAVGCSLVGDIKLERRLYARAWPLGVLPLGILMAAAAALIVCSRIQ
jgi:lactate permease